MFLLTLIVSFITVLPLLARGYFPMHDDLQVMRMFELQKCFADGQIPCRWAVDMTFGYGQAMFNFYSAFPYYLGVLIRLIAPFSIIDTVKILFAISLVASGVGMYLLAKEFFGKNGGFIASVLYMLAPYRAVNVYVRGAMAEAFSLALLPFLWFSIYKTIKTPSYKNVLILALVAAAQLTTHNISTMVYAPFTLIWALFWIIKEKDIKKTSGLFIGSVLGIGLASFFIIPVFLEKHLIKEEIFTSDYSYFASHFVSLKQLFFSRFWGYGGSVFGENDHMSFQVGVVHWIIGGLVGFISLYKFVRTKKHIWFLTAMLFVFGVFSFFLTHQRSHLIWEAIPTLSFVQFPWRFLGLGIFFLSFSVGSLSLVKVRFLWPVSICILAFATILLNISYFKPNMHFYDESDETKLSGELFYIQQKSAYLDYLPKTVKEAPLGLAPDRPQIVNGEGQIPNFTKTSSTFFFDAEIINEAEVDIPIIYFPDWEVYRLDGQGIKLVAMPKGKHGTIHIQLPEGKHMIYGRFINTPIRTISNIITLITILILIAGSIVTLNKRKFLGLQ